MKGNIPEGTSSTTIDKLIIQRSTADLSTHIKISPLLAYDETFIFALLITGPFHKKGYATILYIFHQGFSTKLHQLLTDFPPDCSIDVIVDYQGS